MQGTYSCGHPNVNEKINRNFPCATCSIKEPTGAEAEIHLYFEDLLTKCEDAISKNERKMREITSRTTRQDRLRVVKILRGNHASIKKTRDEQSQALKEKVKHLEDFQRKQDEANLEKQKMLDRLRGSLRNRKPSEVNLWADEKERDILAMRKYKKQIVEDKKEELGKELAKKW